jgi:hypothetical protein
MIIRKKKQPAVNDLFVKGGQPDRNSRGVRNSYMPDARECTLLLLRLIQAKEIESNGPVSRFRISELSLQRTWGRRRITPDFIEAVNEWLFRADRVIFYAGSSYGVLLTDAVESWIRLSSHRVAAEVEEVLAGAYDFKKIEDLLGGAVEVNEEEANARPKIVRRPPREK